MAVITSLNLYQECLNTVFRLTKPDGAPVDLTLTQVSKSIDDEFQLAFSLMFQGSTEPLPQRTYRLWHERLKEVDLFLVPVRQRRGGGLQYEAVFNLIKETGNAANP